MYNNCCVVSCASRRKGTNLFRFPKQEHNILKWLKFINCEQLQSLSRHDLNKQFVCLKHFEKKFVVSNPNRERTRLYSKAYPTLFTKTEISSGIPHISSEIQKVTVDHNYFAKRHYDHNYAKAISFENLENLQLHGSLPDPTLFMESSKDIHDSLCGPYTLETQNSIPALDQALLVPDRFQLENCSNLLCQQESLDMKDSTPFIETNLDNDNESLSEFITIKTENSTPASDHALLVFEDSQVEMSSALLGKQKSSDINDSTPFIETNSDNDNESLSEFIKIKTENSTPASDHALLVFEDSQVEMSSALLGKQKSSDINDSTPFIKKTSDYDNKYLSEFITFKSQNSTVADQALLVSKSSQAEIGNALLCKQKSSDMNVSSLRIAKNKNKVVVHNVHKMSPDCKLLYDENKKLRKRLKARKRKRFSKEQCFEKLTSKMSEYAKTLFWTQIKMSMKKKKGRRFTQQEKTFSLEIYKKNPECYRFLQQIFILPSRNTLKRLVTQLAGEPHVNPEVYENCT